MFFIPSPPKTHLGQSSRRKQVQPQDKGSSEPPKWSDWGKWWMDILKSLIVLLIGIWISQAIIKKLDKEAEEHKFLLQANYKINLDRFEEFKRTSAHLPLAALRVATSPSDRQRMQEYAAMDSIQYQLAVSGIKERFQLNEADESSILAQMLSALEESQKEMNRQLRNYIYIRENTNPDSLKGTAKLWSYRFWTEGFAFEMARIKFMHQRAKVIKEIEKRMITLKSNEPVGNLH